MSVLSLENSNMIHSTSVTFWDD